jgi:hypothetical protein
MADSTGFGSTADPAEGGSTGARIARQEILREVLVFDREGKPARKRTSGFPR